MKIDTYFLPESEHQRLRDELNDFLEFFERNDAVWDGMEEKQ